MSEAIRLTNATPNGENPLYKETVTSIIIRVSAVSLSTITVVTGILLLTGVFPLSSPSALILGWTMVGIGFPLLFAGFALKCVRETKSTAENLPKNIPTQVVTAVPVITPSVTKFEYDPTLPLNIEHIFEEGTAADLLRVLKQENQSLPLLHYAARYDRRGHVLEELLKTEDVNAITLQSGKAMTPLHYAAAYNTPRIAKLLIDKGARKTGGSLHLACQRIEDSESIEMIALLATPKTINAQDDLGRTPLQYACRQGSLLFFEKLVSLGADVNIRSHENKSLLHDAINSLPILQQLIDRYKLDINEVGKDGNTVLDHASQENKRKLDPCIIPWMIKRGAKYYRMADSPNLQPSTQN